MRWESTRGNPRRARRVRLDSEGRIEYNVPFMVVVEEFSVENTLILISTLPVALLKRKQRFRPKMPSQAIALKRHYLARLFPCPMLMAPESLEEDRCKVCVLASRLVQKAFSAEHEVYVCSSCLCSWHNVCAKFVAQARGKPDMPFDWAAYVCPCCQTDTDMDLDVDVAGD